MDGSGLLILLLVNSFHNSLHAIIPSRWQRIANSFSHQWLSWQFVRCIAQWILADSSDFRSSTAFTRVCTLYCIADGSGLLILPLVNGFDNCLHTILPHEWQLITHFCTCLQLSQCFARCISQRMVADCSFFCSSTTFRKVYTLYCPLDIN